MRSFLLILLSFFYASFSYAQLLTISPESVEAKAWSVIDAQSGQIISEHNSNVQRSPASLTKMMVAYIALKEIQAGRLRKEEIITATPVVNMVMWDESQMYLKEGENISVDQLLAGLIVMSANDAAVTLAERISGNVPNFLMRMNQEAHQLGMENTHFSNPAGVTMSDHYSTAHDLSLLGLALVNQTPDYLNYSKQPSFSYNRHFHYATNSLLRIDSSVDGLKTGFTKAAGYNLAVTAQRPSLNTEQSNRRLIVVVLGAANAMKRAEIAHKLMNLAYTYTRNEQILKNKQLIAELPVFRSTSKTFKIEVNQPSIITTSLYDSVEPIQLSSFDSKTQRLHTSSNNGLESIIPPLETTKTRINFELKEEKLVAPLKQVVQLATIHIYQNNHLIHSININEDIDIKEANIFQRLILWIKALSPFSKHDANKAKLYPIH